jgi:hypothetical protein
VRGLDRADQHRVVVEVQEAIGQALDAPQHGFDGQRVEGGQQLLIAAENLAVIDNANIRPFGPPAIDRGRNLVSSVTSQIMRTHGA